MGVSAWCALILLLPYTPPCRMASNSSGFECNFETKPDGALDCLICLAVARDPLQHEKCGRLFCEKCLNKHGKDKSCPNCRMEQPLYFEDNRSKRIINTSLYHCTYIFHLGKREIKALRVKCDNVEKGCKWKGTVGTLEEHMTTCEFTPVPCPKKCKQNDKIQMIARKDLGKHLKEKCVNRDYKCKHCKKKDTYINITDIHDYICEKKIILCPNSDCFKSMEQGKMAKHVENDCEYTVVPCKYESIGCHKKLKRKDMGAHEQDYKVHFHQALRTVVTLQEGRNTLKKGEPFVFKLTGYEQKRKNNETIYSQSFYTCHDGYKMCIKVCPNGYGAGRGTHVSVYTPLLKGNNDNDLNWPFIGIVKFELLNQLEDSDHYVYSLSFTSIKNACVGSSWGFHEFIPHTQLAHHPVKNKQYLCNDTLYIRISVEVSNHNCKHWLEYTAM